MDKEFIWIYITTPNTKVAEEIGDKLLQKKWVACVNIFNGVQSMYWWEGKIEKDEEVVMIAKSQKVHFENIKKEVKAHHPYDCPCILSLPISDGNEDYLNWILKETKI